MDIKIIKLILILPLVKLYQCHNNATESNEICRLDFFDLINYKIINYDYENLWIQSMIRCADGIRNTVITDKLTFLSCDEAVCIINCATQEMTNVRITYIVYEL